MCQRSKVAKAQPSNRGCICHLLTFAVTGSLFDCTLQIVEDQFDSADGASQMSLRKLLHSLDGVREHIDTLSAVILAGRLA